MNKLKFGFIGMLLVTATVLSAQNDPWAAWDYSTKTAIDGKTTEIATAGKYANVSLVVRCSKTCEVYIVNSTEIFAEQGTVRVKFNKSAVKQFAVSRGDGSDSLFFRDPWSILRAIRDNGGYLTVEYRPYEKTPDTTTFGVWNLPPSILRRIPK
jgi:hypothetical protein